MLNRPAAFRAVKMLALVAAFALPSFSLSFPVPAGRRTATLLIPISAPAPAIQSAAAVPAVNSGSQLFGGGGSIGHTLKGKLVKSAATVAVSTAAGAVAGHMLGSRIPGHFFSGEATKLGAEAGLAVGLYLAKRQWSLGSLLKTH